MNWNFKRSVLYPQDYVAWAYRALIEFSKAKTVQVNKKIHDDLGARYNVEGEIVK